MATFNFNIHGLTLEISAADPIFDEFILEELKSFRVKKKLSGPSVLKLNFQVFDGKVSQPEMASHSFFHSGNAVFNYGKSLITVTSHYQARRINVKVALGASIFPDPAYHYCLTQPLSLWLKEKGLFFLHASCVSFNDQGILVIGHSRVGKSTLALSAVRKGFHFLSDEQPLLSLSNGLPRVHAFHRRIRLDRSTAAVFPELSFLVKSRPQERLVFPIEEIWPKSLKVTACTPRLLIFPCFRTNGTLKITRLHPAEALDRLLKDDHFVWYKDKPWDKISYKHLALFQSLANQTKAYSLEYRQKNILQIPSIFERLLRD